MRDKFPITLNGYNKLEEELKQLKTVERPAISGAISEARELGDLSENAEYHAAREKQSFIEGRIIELEDKVARADIIDVSKLSGTTVRFGATVKIVDEDTDIEKIYQITGEYEADLDQGLISIVSPLARALIGKNEGDSVEVNTPNGIRSYEILSVRYI
ncbi:Transcription elongation factor GreA [Candidatus Arcanobacter lacustris]|jgi:transcription elongation factor GreA|uniref:Transcription elongation factor GreA n=1 Tax=Candidatus Arcanibacter lacustris TaxID=1607817 RepID=A0A0F5MQ58_9RICK|nr:Transcription elongation factor GreA [Candidatus Arcanobacter lacustris]